MAREGQPISTSLSRITKQEGHKKSRRRGKVPKHLEDDRKRAQGNRGE
jgi:hypothetical protein